jgi:hypothetical protein
LLEKKICNNDWYMDEHSSPVFPGSNPTPGGIFGSPVGSAGTVHGYNEIVRHHENPLLTPAYYKAYIIRRTTIGKTNGPAG